ncbi:hypothetical protein [Ruegeria atlantica]|nr:hypothetical protein [Ruegeria atlantica]
MPIWELMMRPADHTVFSVRENPLLNPAQSSVTLIGLRAQIAFCGRAD